MNYRKSLLAGSVSLFALAASLGACTASLGPDEEDAGAGGSNAVEAVGGAPSGGASGSGGAASGGAASGGAASGGAAASGGETGGVPEPAPTFANLQTVIKYTTPNCAGSDCHGGGHNPLNLVLDDGLYARLLDPTYISEMCDDLPLITPGDPAQSALFVIMTDGCWTTEMKGGEEVPLLLRMPAGCEVTEFGSNCVEQEYLDGIEQWILDGAPQN